MYVQFLERNTLTSLLGLMYIILQAGWLETQNFIVSHLWRLEG